MRPIALALLGLLLMPGVVGAQVEDADSIAWRDYDSLSRKTWMGVTQARARSSDAGSISPEQAEAVLIEAVATMESVEPTTATGPITR